MYITKIYTDQACNSPGEKPHQNITKKLAMVQLIWTILELSVLILNTAYIASLHMTSKLIKSSKINKHRYECPLYEWLLFTLWQIFSAHNH